MPTPADLLARLGAGEPIPAVCTAAGLTREQFDGWWRDECRRRVPPASGTVTSPALRGPVRIDRDARGVPHITAGNDVDLFFGFGYATAQDRLFQLDYLRRKAAGRLAEVLGPEAVESDRLYRTVGLPGIADAEWAALPADTRDLVTAFTAGVNAVIDASRDALPIEFDLLGYKPEPWAPVDCLLIACEFRFYLTVRFPVIAIPELVKRAVGDGPLYRAFTTAEADGESILHRGEYTPGNPFPSAGQSGDSGPGSNNWVLAGHRTPTGKPLVASDPHVMFGAVSIWYEVALNGGSFRVAGAALAGMPALMVGRTDRVAWGITNNICMQRDLYQEKTDPAHPNSFLFGGKWEPAAERKEVIRVRGAEPVSFVVKSSRNGPVVDAVMPAAARHTGPVSLKWQGAEPCGWLTALLGMNRAKTAAEFREACRPWGVPTFNLVYADADGHTGFQTTGKIPLRDTPGRGYRPGWDPAHQWRGTIPFDELPHLADPPRGYVATANNRVAPDDFPRPLFGCWANGHRAQRLRELIGPKPVLAVADSQAIQHDVLSRRATDALPAIVPLLKEDAAKLLAGWDGRMAADSAAASVFHLFFYHWVRAVLAERLPAEQVEFAAALGNSIAGQLLHADPHGWFRKQDRHEAIRGAFRKAVEDLTARLGPDPAGWAFGRVHTLSQKHFLSGRGDLGTLLDRSGAAVGGDGTTLFAGTADAAHNSYLGAGYRMVADLADPDHALLAIEVGSQSGHPGSPHYDDQLAPWLAGRYFRLSMTAGPAEVSGSLRIEAK